MRTLDPVALFSGASAEFGRRVHAVPPALWSAPTPCPGWDVRVLVNHLAVEDLWAVPIFDGRTIAEVGDRFEGDQLGVSPVERWDEAAAGAIVAISGPGAMTRTVHLSFGDLPGSEYTMQLFADHLIHAWDLAAATGLDTRLDEALVGACTQWFAANEDVYRQGGVIGPRPSMPADADEQDQLLVAFGRSPSFGSTA